MNMRKIIAVLSAALLLCAAIPMGALTVVAAPGDVIIDADFNDGADGFYFGNDPAPTQEGNLILDGAAAPWANVWQGVNMSAETEYVVTFRAKADAAQNLYFKINNGWSGTNVQEAAAITTEWAEYELFLTPDANLSSPVFCIQTGTELPEQGTTFYLDWVKVVEKPLEVGVVANGDFETGNTNGWNTHETVTAEAAAAHDGNYGAHLTDRGTWGGIMDQTVIVEAGKTYQVSFWIKVNKRGINLQILDNGDKQAPLASGTWFDASSHSEWTQKIYYVTPATNAIFFNFCGAGGATPNPDDETDTYIDSFSISLVKTPSFDGYITNGDFEIGKTDYWKTYQSTVLSEDAAHSGDYGIHIVGVGNWGGLLEHDVANLTVGQKYLFSFWMKVNHPGVNVSIGDSYIKWFGAASDWALITHEFTAADTTALLKINGGGSADPDPSIAADIYVDDFSIMPLVEESNDGYIKNGTLDTGNTNGWEVIWPSQAEVSLVNGGKDSAFAVQVNGKPDQNYGQFRQKVTVEPNTNYRFSVWAKNSSNMTLLVKDGNDKNNLKQANAAAGEEWTLITNEFNSGDNTSVYVSVMISAIGGHGTFDGFAMKKLIDPSFDGFLYNGDLETGEIAPWNCLYGTSIAEIVEGMNGGSAMSIVAKQYSHVRQVNIAVEPNTTYKVTVWAKNTNNMCVLVKGQSGTGSPDWVPETHDIINNTFSAGEEWTEITYFFNSGDHNWVVFDLMGGEKDEAGDRYGTFDNIKMEKHEHEYESEETKAPTCTDAGEMTYTCAACGDTYTESIDALGHIYTDCLDTDCDECGEVREPVGHILTHYDAAVAANCQETSHEEYWYCENCGCYFGDAEATWQHNPHWLFTPGECVRPEGAADCAIVPCEVCGNDVYGYGDHDVVVCQGGTCSKCNAEIEGYGCQNFDTPACEDGVCYYCGGFVAGFGHENGSWAACCDGECSYGCGLQYPATEDHVDADANDYCDNCWNHLACADEDADGWCDVCWREMPAVEIIYGDANGDGQVTILDAALLSQHLTGWAVELNEAGADANGDGQVTILDAALLSQHLTGWSVTLGPV